MMDYGSPDPPKAPGERFQPVTQDYTPLPKGAGVELSGSAYCENVMIRKEHKAKRLVWAQQHLNDNFIYFRSYPTEIG